MRALHCGYVNIKSHALIALRVFHLLLCKLFQDFHHGCEFIHEVHTPLTVGDLYQQKDQLETERNSWITRTIDKST